MSPVVPPEAQAGRPPVQWSRRFRRKASAKVPTADELRRQDAVLRSAWRSLGQPGPVIAFLNTHNESLGARPIYLALESDEGLLRVEGLLGEIGQSPARRA